MEYLSEKLRVVQNDNSTSYLTNDTFQHFVIQDSEAISPKTLCGNKWRKWLSAKPQRSITGMLCSKCEKIATKNGWYKANWDGNYPKFAPRAKVWFGIWLAEIVGLLTKNDDGQYVYMVDIFPNIFNNSNFVNVSEDLIKLANEGEY